jgi:hypothetical protein
LSSPSPLPICIDRYDGNLGIIVAIAAVKAMGVRQMARQGGAAELSEAGVAVVPQGLLSPVLKHPLHIVAFCDEEGVRFKSTFLGSRAIVGSGAPGGVCCCWGRGAWRMPRPAAQRWRPSLPTRAPALLQAGTHGQHGVLFARDEDNSSVIEVLRSNGVPDPQAAVGELAIPPIDVKHYIEVGGPSGSCQPPFVQR